MEIEGRFFFSGSVQVVGGISEKIMLHSFRNEQEELRVDNDYTEKIVEIGPVAVKHRCKPFDRIPPAAEFPLDYAPYMYHHSQKQARTIQYLMANLRYRQVTYAHQ